jgi:hypothetical protein
MDGYHALVAANFSVRVVISPGPANCSFRPAGCNRIERSEPPIRTTGPSLPGSAANVPSSCGNLLVSVATTLQTKTRRHPSRLSDVSRSGQDRQPWPRRRRRGADRVPHREPRLHAFKFHAGKACAADRAASASPRDRGTGTPTSQRRDEVCQLAYSEHVPRPPATPHQNLHQSARLSAEERSHPSSPRFLDGAPCPSSVMFPGFV